MQRVAARSQDVRKLLVWMVAALLVAGCSTSSGAEPPAATPTPAPPPSTAPPTTVPPPPELPRGGRRVFPDHRLVGFAGAPGSEAFGRLGVGDINDRVRELERLGRAYTDGRRLLPVLELITVTAHATPGPDGMYRSRVGDEVIKHHLRVAREHDALLLLNVQPGRADFLDEVKGLERWLKEPDVGVALDPEWAVDPGEVPGEVFGRSSGEELDQVAAYLAGLIAEHRLPQKVMVYHQLHVGIVENEHALGPHRGVVAVKTADGIGSRQLKEEAYRVLIPGRPEHVHPGFKLFYEEDRRHGDLMTSEQVLALRPQPEYILYE